MKPQPTEIENILDGSIRVKWADGHQGVYGGHYLRVNCHCAACVEEWTGRQLVLPDNVPQDITPLKISPVGQYALHIEWSDGHATGIYSFDLLRSLCPCEVCRVKDRGEAALE